MSASPQKRPVFIGAATAVTALGASLDTLWPALLEGRSAIGPVGGRFSTESLAFHEAACIPDLDPLEPPHQSRTVELLSRCLEGQPPLSDETFVIWTGVKGDAEYVEALCDLGAKPSAIAQLPYLPEHYRHWACERLGLQSGNGLELNAACASSTAGLALGANRIASGENDTVLVCAADLASRFTFTGFSVLKALSPTRCRPFDAQRDGLSLGDGASAILLCSEETLASHNLSPLGRLTGWGIANDANHITGPARDGCGLTAAIRLALNGAGLFPETIGAFCAHGTGTPYNDAMELTALESVFGERRFPLFSIKGAIGHTLGAGGAIEVGVCLKAFAERCVPPTAGLERPEPRAEGRACGKTQNFPNGAILTTNSGFGGINAALILENA
jgi:3-oxoacyl-[acyl-carrier-protein] synthase II